MMKAEDISRFSRRVFATTAVFTLTLIGVSAAQAQVPEAQIDTAGPGRVSEQFREGTIMPEIMPEIEVQELKLIGAPEGAENVRFNLKTIRLSGVSAYTDEELKGVYAGSIGQTITLADLYGIANAMTVKYRNDGYILTQVIVPPQTIESGVARLQVVEGAIDSVSVQGEDGPALDLIRSYAANISSNGPLNVKDLERTLLLINDLPGVEARSILSPSPGRTGAADLRIIIKRDPYDALLAIDNYGSRYLGPVQATAAGSLNNPFFDQNERITAQAVIAPDPDIGLEMAYFSLEYEQPVWSYGTMLQIFTSYTHTEPGYTLDQFNVEGKSHFASIQLEHPFIRSRSLNLFGRALFDFRDVDSQNDIEPTRKDRIRALRAGGRLEFLDTLLGVGVNSFDLEFAQGLKVLGASEDGRDNLSRPAADTTFFKMEAEAQRLQRVTKEINLLLAVRGQWSANTLLSSEEFGVGGINYGRGYNPSEIVGEDGVAGKVELQWNQPYQWDFVQDYQLFGFWDGGRVWNDDATTSAGKRDSLASAGFGIRAEFMEQTGADFFVAFPLTRDIETENDRDPRVYFALSRRF